jgi:copper chaperone CopZ
MKIKELAILLLIMSLVAAGAHAAKKPSKNAEILIKTSAQCGMCKERIEKQLGFTKGVKKAVLDVETREVKVVYRSDKTNPDEIRKAIAAIGYDADEVKADPVAYEKLPACCKKGGH